MLLLGLLLASPPFAAWLWMETKAAEPQWVANSIPANPLSDGAVQVPIEVVAEGSAPQWVYVAVSNQAVPEPGVVSLLAIGSLLLLRRQRCPK